MSAILISTKANMNAVVISTEAKMSPIVISTEAKRSGVERSAVKDGCPILSIAKGGNHDRVPLPLRALMN